MRPQYMAIGLATLNNNDYMNNNNGDCGHFSSAMREYTVRVLFIYCTSNRILDGGFMSCIVGDDVRPRTVATVVSHEPEVLKEGCW